MPLIFTTIQHEFRKQNSLSCNEYVLADMIYQLAVNPGSKVTGWCYMSRNEIADNLGVSKQSVLNIINGLIKKGFLEKDAQTSFLRTTITWNLVYFTDGKLSLPERFTDGKESLPIDGKESLPEGVKKVDPIYIEDNNNIDNKNILLRTQNAPATEQENFGKNTEVKSSQRKRTFAERELKFKKSLNVYARTRNNPDGYPAEMLVEFANFWSEPNKSGTDMKWELEKTWKLSGRIATWAKRAGMMQRSYQKETHHEASSLLAAN
jgi:hypothetical protein